MRKIILAITFAALPLLALAGGCSLTVDHDRDVGYYRSYDGHYYARPYGHYEMREFPDGHRDRIYVRDY